MVVSMAASPAVLTLSLPCRIPSLNQVVLDDAVKDGVVVIAFKAQLHKIAASLQQEAATRGKCMGQYCCGS